MTTPLQKRQAFVNLLNLDTHLPTRKGDKLVWTCGLEISIPSVEKIRDVAYLTRGRDIFQAAHQRHHEPGHLPSATMYFTSEGKPHQLVSAECSCFFDTK